MDKRIKLRLISDQEHNSQIVTGFLMLADRYHVEIQNDIVRRGKLDWSIPHIVECEYAGLKIAYDTSDGYFEDIQSWVKKYDLYFKRSFSKEKNLHFLGESLSQRVHPLGFNYFVTCPGNPYGEVNRSWKNYVRGILGRKEKDYFTPEKFQYMERENLNGKVIFFTRLWKPETYLSDEVNAQRETINAMRIDLLRRLREELGTRFVGGLFGADFETQMAPDLVVPRSMTRRENYLKLLHTSDIAIGSTGLHDSIGWKTGEYVAAGKAIVNETFCYEVPGGFCEGKNYLTFDDSDTCIAHVKYLLSHPDAVLEMQRNNRMYYDQFLAPDKMIDHTLAIADGRESPCN